MQRRDERLEGLEVGARGEEAEVRVEEALVAARVRVEPPKVGDEVIVQRGTAT